MRALGRTATPECRDGDPVDEILDTATLRRADLIALGTRGRGGFARLLLGSVAHGVLQRGTRYSVLITRAR